MPTKSRSRRRLSKVSNVKNIENNSEYNENTPVNNKIIASTAEGFHNNDDLAEKRKRRQSRVRPQMVTFSSPVPTEGRNEVGGKSTSRRKSISRRRRRSSIGGALRIPSLTGTELDELFEECIGLSTHNKITQKNSWSLKLIDYLPDVLETHQQPDNPAGIPNFQAASCTLDASVKIYSCRVDAVHSDAYKVLGGLSRNAKKNKAGSSSSTDGDDNGGKRKGRSVSTLVKENDQSSITTKISNLMFSVDPLFHKTSASFDAGGASGVLLNQLRIGKNCDVIFSGADEPVSTLEEPHMVTESTITEVSNEEDTVPVKGREWDVSGLAKLTSTKDLSCALICPSFSGFKLYDTNYKHNNGYNKNNNNKKNENNNNNNPDISSTEDYDDIIEGGIFSGVGSHIDFDRNDGFSNIGGGQFDWDDLPDDNEEQTMFIGDIARGEHQNNNIHDSSSFEGIEIKRNTIMQRQALISNLSYPFLIKASSLSWAGPAHWKFKASSKAKTISSGESNKVTKVSRKKKKFFIDFTNGNVDDNKVFARSRAATTLSKAVTSKTNEETTTLPEDTHYDSKRLLQLFLKPNTHVWSSSLHGMVGSGDNQEYGIGTFTFGSPEYGGTQDLGDTSMDDDNDDGFYFNDIPITNSETQLDPINISTDDLTLIAQPQQVQKVQIHYAKVAKKVDVKALKNVIWTGLCSEKRRKVDESLNKGNSNKNKGEHSDNDNDDDEEEDDEDEEKEEALSFQDTIWTMSDKISGTPTLQEASVPFCFICLLHLANEKHLVLEESEADTETGLSDLHVVMQT